VFVAFLIVSLVSSFYRFPSLEAQETNVFGNPQLPDWRTITVTEYAEILVVDNDDGFVWEFPKAKDKFNQIYQNDTLIVKDEQWLLVGSDLKEDSHPIQRLEWTQPEPYHVVVTDFYEDLKKNNTFQVIYSFYGGFRTKVSLNASVGTSDVYSVVWRCWLYKDYALNMTNYVKFWNEDEIPIVFDYTDVYESFGDITEADVSGWFKGKRFDEKFKVGFLELGIFLLDPNFGYETQGGASVQFADYIMGTPYTCPEAGTATSVSVYISVGATPCGKFKCAIYKVSDDSLVAYTEELEGISSFSDFKTLDIVWGGTLTATDYYLMWWTDDATNIAFWYSTDIAGAYDAETYDGFPATLNPTVYGSHKFSIYCTYTTDGGQEYERTASQGIGVSLSASKSFEITRSVTQGIGVGLSASRLFEITRTVTQAIGIGLEAVGFKEFFRREFE